MYEHKGMSLMADQSEQIRIVIADDIAETRDILEKALYFEKDIVVVGKAANGREAVQLCKQHNPDIVLMDINMPEMDGIAATEALMEQAPSTQVIIMSVQNEQEYLRRAMLAGAREYLIKPPDTDELIRSIRHVYKLRQTRPQGAMPNAGPAASTNEQGHVVAVFSPKGGAGCTVVATNLAVALKRITGKQVVLVDGDVVFGDVGVALNIVANKTVADLASRTHDLDAQLISDVLATHASGVQVLLAPPDSQSGESIGAEQMRAILDALRKQFDYVIVDTQTSYDDRTLAILDVADRIVALTTLELPAIKNVKQFLEIAAPLGYADEKLMLVLNKADSRLGIRAAGLEQQMRHKITAQIANAPHDVTLSLNQGVPLAFDRRSHPIASAITTLAALLVKSFDPSAPIIPTTDVASAPAPEAPGKPGLLDRLFGKGSLRWLASLSRRT
jgi:pilus assembly protein CpaE